MKTAEKKTPFDQTRRSFLKLSGLLGIGVASTAVLPAAKAEAFLFNKDEYKVSNTRLAMGTFVAMTAIHPSRDQAQEAMEKAFAEIDRLNKMLTHYESVSPVGSLNGKGRLEDAPQEMLDLVARSYYYNHQTGGAFDITVKPLIDLYKNSFAANHKPSDAEIEKSLKLVGFNRMRVQGRNIEFGSSDMGITLDGIAKGYIVDRASEVLRAHGVKNHLINAGGDIRTSGTAAKGKAWTVAVQDPAKSKEYPDIVTMKDGAIATSGNYEIYYDKEKLFHHIIDSNTGHSPQLSTSVTVVASSVMDADALATSVFVMAPEQGIRFIEGQPECECFIIGKNSKFFRSSGWQV